MAEILGYDCEGKALRRGDRVTVVRCVNSLYRDLIGTETTIRGLSPVNPEQLDTDIRARSPMAYPYVSGTPQSFRRIGDDTGDWSEIEHATGWSPKEASCV